MSEAQSNTAPGDEKRPLIEHLVELRRRVMIAAAAFLVATGVSYHFAPEIYSFLVRPLAESLGDASHRRLIYTGLTEAFFTYLKLAVFTGIFLSFPVTAAQAYRFVAPGLYRKERWLLVPYLFAAPVMFLAGAAFCYYVVFPSAWRFFVGFETVDAGGLPIQLEARVGEYLSLSMHLMLAFGLAFQLPVALLLLAQTGVVQAKMLAKSRRFAIVGIAVAAAVLTPPDALSMIALALPLYGLYELSIILCRMVEKPKETEAHA